MTQISCPPDPIVIPPADLPSDHLWEDGSLSGGANPSAASGVWTQILYNVTDPFWQHDTLGRITVDAVNSRLIATEDGVYSGHGTVRINNPVNPLISPRLFEVEIRKNGVSHRRHVLTRRDNYNLMTAIGGGSLNMVINVPFCTYLEVGDYIEVWFRQSNPNGLPMPRQSEPQYAVGDMSKIGEVKPRIPNGDIDCGGGEVFVSPPMQTFAERINALYPAGTPGLCTCHQNGLRWNRVIDEGNILPYLVDFGGAVNAEMEQQVLTDVGVVVTRQSFSFLNNRNNFVFQVDTSPEGTRSAAPSFSRARAQHRIAFGDDEQAVPSDNGGILDLRLSTGACFYDGDRASLDSLLWTFGCAINNNTAVWDNALMTSIWIQVAP